MTDDFNDFKVEVWLVNIPQGVQGVQGGSRGIKNFYENLIKKYFITTGTPLSPLSPSNKKGEQSNANNN